MTREIWEYLSLTKLGEKGAGQFQINWIAPVGEFRPKKPEMSDAYEEKYEARFRQEAEAAQGVQTFGLIQAFNILGADGWELIVGMPNNNTFVFKRPTS